MLMQSLIADRVCLVWMCVVIVVLLPSLDLVPRYILGGVVQPSFVPKRIHFGTATFKMGMNLACMDWVRQIKLIAHFVLF